MRFGATVPVTRYILRSSWVLYTVMFEILGAKNSCRGSPWQHISIAALFDGICLRNQDIKLGGGGVVPPEGLSLRILRLLLLLMHAGKCYLQIQIWYSNWYPVESTTQNYSVSNDMVVRTCDPKPPNPLQDSLLWGDKNAQETQINHAPYEPSLPAQKKKTFQEFRLPGIGYFVFGLV